ncbi:MAG: hypothetical protein ABS76_26810 [Pelagibacterium sp. SCN 64-44]|mgnify:CR=1 FL=1|nr:MAG: hypothetical protein ABS76_26810 [Pelagibacterium sp. SCN 64-44]
MDIAAFLGGIGLFLLGMSMMTDGLRLAAGPTLKSILGRWTRTAGRGLVAGAVITAIVQSSSATSVSMLGFVNAGFLSLQQAVWVVFGAHVGTTTTGWLVAIAGVRFSMTGFGLPLIGLGMLVQLFSGDRPRLAGLGRAVAGFGAFFMGIGILQSAFAGFGFSTGALGVDEDSVVGLFAFMISGIVLTLMTQSASATVAITLTAVSSGAVSLAPAAAIIVGANIGMTSPAVIAALGATAAARRTALSEVLFSLIAALAAFCMLPLYLWVCAEALKWTGLPDDGVMVLAAFHTLLNLMGVVLIWPLAPLLFKVISRLFVSAEEELARPQFLDATIVGVSDLAASGLYHETRRALRLSMEFARDRLEAGPVRPAATRRRGIRLLLEEIRGFVDTAMTAQPFSDAAAHAIPELVRALQHGEELLALPPETPDPALGGPLRQALVDAVLACLVLPAEGEDRPEIALAAQKSAESAYDAFKHLLLQELAHRLSSVERIDQGLAWAQALKRISYVTTRSRLRILAAAAYLKPGEGQAAG